MMPRVSLHGGALHVSAKTDHVSVEDFFYDDDDDQDDEREGRGRVVRQKKFPHTLNGKTERGSKYANSDNHRRDRLRFTVTVGMSRVRWTRSECQSAPDHNRAANIQCRLDP